MECELTGVSLTRVTPFSVMPIFFAALLERSRLRPLTKGPRSLMRTFTDCPFCGLVTFTVDPIGKVREAAVKSFGLYGSPLAVVCPAVSLPWNEVVTVFDGFGELLGIATAAGGGRVGAEARVPCGSGCAEQATRSIPRQRLIDGNARLLAMRPIVFFIRISIVQIRPRHPWRNALKDYRQNLNRLLLFASVRFRCWCR